MYFRLTITDRLTGRELDSRTISGRSELETRYRSGRILVDVARANGYDLLGIQGDLQPLAPTPTAIPAPFVAAFVGER